MQEKEVCEICLHTITNPICADCYLNHARSWLIDFGACNMEIRRALKEIKSRLPEETLNEHECIICNMEKVSLCMYCAFLRSSKTLLKVSAVSGDAKKAYLESLENQCFGE
jgi:hypothetical protein